MIAMTFASGGDLCVQPQRAVPVPADGEALIRVARAGICSTDLEICRGYVPGFDGVLGHEFCGCVEACVSAPQLVGRRVVGEINCNGCHFSCGDAVFTRNHAPGRTVLGIIGRDGAMAEYVTLPAANLHLVPDALSDQQACFAEPLAAACRILEQGLPKPGSRVAVLGDGKLGLLVAAALALRGEADVTLFGRHAEKMALLPALPRLVARLDAAEAAAPGHAAAFDMVVEATGSAGGIRTALALTRPLGTLLLKSTVSAAAAPAGPAAAGDSPAAAAAAAGAAAAPMSWSEIANDIVVNEKVLVGSRCGPMDVALELLAGDEGMRQLVDAMTAHVFHARDGLAAFEAARQRGALKVQLRFD